MPIKYENIPQQDRIRYARISAARAAVLREECATLRVSAPIVISENEDCYINVCRFALTDRRAGIYLGIVAITDWVNALDEVSRTQALSDDVLYTLREVLYAYADSGPRKSAAIRSLFYNIAEKNGLSDKDTGIAWMQHYVSGFVRLFADRTK